MNKTLAGAAIVATLAIWWHVTAVPLVLPPGVPSVQAGVLPDPLKTPGAVNPNVTQANIQQTICVANWTSTIRPPSSYTTKLKVTQLASGYAVNGDTATASYEEDHLISLELGGNPTDPKNLWPESYKTTPNAKNKDSVENWLHKQVCAGAMPLAEAQFLVSNDWLSVYAEIKGAPPSPSTTDN
jgi:hypothetical protein